MDKQTRNILIITIGTVGLTIIAVYFFGVLLPLIKNTLWYAEGNDLKGLYISIHIRKATAKDYSSLREMLYVSIHVPPWAEMPPLSITELPELQYYIKDRMTEKDAGFVAEIKGENVGAVWGRILSTVFQADTALFKMLYRSFALQLKKSSGTAV